MHSQSVPDYFVYGEEARDLEPGFIHVELVSSRYSVHRGVVADHKHPQMAQITFWHAGGGSYRIEDKSWIFSAPAISFVSSDIVHGFAVSKTSDAIVLSIANAAFESMTGHALELSATSGFRQLRGAEANTKSLNAIMTQVLAEYRDQKSYCNAALANLASLAFIHVARLLGEELQPLARPAETELAEKLRRAVNVHFRENRPVEFYTELLRTTSYLLDKAAKSAFGLPVKAYIVRRRLLEAKRLLHFTVRSSEDIAFELGFKDPAYFNREFKKHTGLAPGLWRNRGSDMTDK